MGGSTRLRPIRITTDMTTIKRKNFTKTTAVRRESLVIVIRFELSPGGKGCGFLFKRTGVRLPYYRGKKQYKTCIYDCVRACTHAHCPLRRKERELARLLRFSLRRELVAFWSRPVGPSRLARVGAGVRSAPVQAPALRRPRFRNAALTIHLPRFTSALAIHLLPPLPHLCTSTT